MQHLFTGLLLSWLICSQGFAQEKAEPKGYFLVQADVGFGYYAWHDGVDEESILRNLGLYSIDNRNPYGYSTRLGFLRRTKRERFTWGLSWYRYDASRARNQTFPFADAQEGDVPFLTFNEFHMSDVGNVFLINFEPRIWHNNRFNVLVPGAVGISYLALDAVVAPASGGPVLLETRRNRNALLMEGALQVGIRLEYDLNSYYHIYVGGRVNHEWTTYATQLVEGYFGVQFNLRKGGIGVN